MTSQLKIEGSFPAWPERIPQCSCRNSRGRRLNKKVGRNSRRRATITKALKMSQSTLDEPYFTLTSLTVTLSIDSHHGGIVWTALWHLEGKPQIRVSTRRKKDTAATAREERGRACLHSRGGPNPLWRLQWNPKNPVSTRH